MASTTSTASTTGTRSDSTNRGFQLPVCPFSVFVFITTVILVTRQQQQKKLQQHRSSCTLRDDHNNDDTTTTALTTNDNNINNSDTVPLYVVFVLGPPGVGMYLCCVLWLHSVRRVFHFTYHTFVYFNIRR
jgi:hypothetical protein